jgi:hypothetical protein
MAERKAASEAAAGKFTAPSGVFAAAGDETNLRYLMHYNGDLRGLDRKGHNHFLHYSAVVLAFLVLSYSMLRQADAEALFVKISVVGSIKGKEHSSGERRGPQLALDSYSETKFHDMSGVLVEKVLVSRPTPQELCPASMNQKIIQGSVRDVDSAACDFRTGSKNKRLIEAFWTRHTELKILNGLDPGYSDERINGCCWRSPGVFPRNPQAQSPNNSILIGKKLMLGLEGKNVSALNSAAINDLANRNEGQDQGCNSEYGCKNIKSRISENQILSRGTA